MTFREIAYAKVNLFLHVGEPRTDGYHPIESLAAFADIGDELQFDAGASEFTIEVDGPFAMAAGTPADNLVLKAAHAFQRKARTDGGGRFLLTKNLPAGAGLGGGSSDAAAALRILAERNELSLDHTSVMEAAAATGADVSVCMEQKARMVSGIGDQLSVPASIPPLPAVLVWPGTAAPTPAVYRAFDEAEMRHSTDFGIRGSDIPTERGAFLSFLAKQNNDLTRAAWRVTPHVAEADAALRAVDRALLVRMSGSGSTVFAIYESEADARREADAILVKYPDWWVRATVLR